MDWKTDSDINGSEEQPYSSFQSNKSGGWFDRMELPIILIGAGLIAIVILFVLFMPRKNQVSMDDYKHIVSRLDQIEKRIDDLVRTDRDIRGFDPAENPVQYQQLVNWIKSNAEVITETMKKMDAIEEKLSDAADLKPAPLSLPTTEKTTVKQKKTIPAAKAPAPEPEKPAITSEPIEASAPVQIKPQTAPKPEPASLPKVSAPAPKIIPKPAPKATPEPTTEIKTQKPVKLIFHRVEKGETLYRISKQYGISVQQLQELNDMNKDELLIHVGQELIVKKEKQ
ncbi:MAG: LysM peptidoglycan-binding domain-containing protein [Desulfobacterales bacterium]